MWFSMWFSVMRCWPAAGAAGQDGGTGTVLRDDQRRWNLDPLGRPCPTHRKCLNAACLPQTAPITQTALYGHFPNMTVPWTDTGAESIMAISAAVRSIGTLPSLASRIAAALTFGP